METKEIPDVVMSVFKPFSETCSGVEFIGIAKGVEIYQIIKTEKSQITLPLLIMHKDGEARMADNPINVLCELGRQQNHRKKNHRDRHR